jgi:hypothetical protein
MEDLPSPIASCDPADRLNNFKRVNKRDEKFIPAVICQKIEAYFLLSQLHVTLHKRRDEHLYQKVTLLERWRRGRPA